MNIELSSLSEGFKVRKSLFKFAKKMDLRKLNSLQKGSELQLTDFKAKFLCNFCTNPQSSQIKMELEERRRPRLR